MLGMHLDLGIWRTPLPRVVSPFLMRFDYSTSLIQGWVALGTLPLKTLSKTLWTIGTKHFITRSCHFKLLAQKHIKSIRHTEIRLHHPVKRGNHASVSLASSRHCFPSARPYFPQQPSKTPASHFLLPCLEITHTPCHQNMYMPGTRDPEGLVGIGG